MDLILYNGNIITMDIKNPRAQAVAICGNKIAAAGSNQDIRTLKDSRTQTLDLKGKTAVPGFNDSHMHLLSYALSAEKADLNGCRSIDGLIDATKRFLAESNIPEGEWVQGRGWNHEFFKEKRMPTRHDLDRISEKHAVVLARTCGHVCAVNTMALKMAGIYEDPPVVEGGIVDKDRSGLPTGILKENAIDLVYRLIPPPDRHKIKELIVRAGKDLLKTGLTSVQTDDFTAVKTDFKDILEAYFELDRDRKLPVRVNEQTQLPTMGKLESYLDLGYKTRHGSSFFKIGPLKLVTDGSLGGRTAALSEPYTDDPGNRGIAIFEQEELDRLVERAHAGGLQIACHAIGDRSMKMAFESYKKALDKYPKPDPRFRIIHGQVTTRDLLEKFRKYDVIADIQPLFVSTDLSIAEERLGKERAGWAYNWKTLLDKGVHVAAGSDCPVESYNPILGIYAAVTRKNLRGYPQDGWLPGQRLSVEEAIRLFTKGSAYASFEESIKGSIAPGKLADMAVLSEDIFNIRPDEIKEVKVQHAIVDGEIGF